MHNKEGQEHKYCGSQFDRIAHVSNVTFHKFNILRDKMEE
jgi:hypothetical protein